MAFILLSFMFLFYHRLLAVAQVRQTHSERQVAQARLAAAGAFCHQEEVLLEVVQLGRGELGDHHLVPIEGQVLQVLHVVVEQLLDSSAHVTHLILEVVRIGLIGVNNTLRPRKSALSEESPHDLLNGGILAEVDDELGHFALLPETILPQTAGGCTGSAGGEGGDDLEGGADGGGLGGVGGAGENAAIMLHDRHGGPIDRKRDVRPP